jgi:hypothetical protein
MRSIVLTRRTRHYVIVCAAASFLAVCGCTDLGEVTQFAKASQDVGKTFSAMADAAKTSCNRANSYINAQNNIPPLDCEFYVQVNSSLVKVNDALFNYIASLGALAADDLSKVPGGFDNVTADLKKADPTISTANQTKATAASGLAKAITNIWASGYRKEKLSKIVGESNNGVQDVTAFLSDYAADKFLQTFNEEERYELSYCDLMKSPTAEPLATDLLARKCAADKVHIETQKAAVKKYQDALKTIAESHNKINEQRGNWNAAQLSKDLIPEIVDLGNGAVSINSAF